jgi:hypothetical protein
MKLQLTTIVLTAGLSAMLGSSTLNAQARKATANIPFAYHVGEHKLSAGLCTIAKTEAPGVFVLRETDTNRGTFMSVTQHSTGDKDAWNLTFSCYANDCSLSQIRMAGDSYNLTARPPVRLGKVAAMISIPLR